MAIIITLTLMQRRFKQTLKTTIAGLCLLVAETASAITMVDSNSTTTAAMEALLSGTGVTVTNLTITNVAGCNSHLGVGIFTNGTTAVGAGPVLGEPTGIVLSTSEIEGANRMDSSNNDDNVTVALCTGTPSDPDMETVEAQVANGEYSAIEFDVVPQFNILALPFQFGSDEFPEYVCSTYNDIVGMFVSGPGIAGPYSGGAENYAKTAAGDLSSINWVNTGVVGNNGNAANCGSLTNTAYYTDNSSGDAAGGSAAVALTNANLEMDGYTNTLFEPITVTAGQTYHVKIAVADAGDRQWDSTVFIHPLFSTDSFDGFDFGDAPDSYGTLTSNGGANHGVEDDIFIGASRPDDEITGIPTVNADGDDLDNTNDEDGIASFPALAIAYTSYSLDVNVTNNTGSPARLIGWIDFNRNGTFETGEGTLTNVANGSTGATATLNWTGLAGLVAGDTYVRIRLSSDLNLTTSMTGSAVSDGEIEDHPLTILTVPLDFGDAPDSFGTLAASAGANHAIDNTIYIGAAAPDAEATGFPSVNADGDDLDNTDDENGVASFPALFTSSASYSLDVNVTNNSGSAANLIGWIDFNGNGTFEATEGTVTNITDGSTGVTATLNWAGLTGLVGGDTYIRIRLSSDPTLTTATTGNLMTDGEVEDYLITILTVNFDKYVSTNATCNDTLDTLTAFVGANVYYCYTVSNPNTAISFDINPGNTSDSLGHDISALEQTYAAAATQTVVVGPIIAGSAQLPSNSTTVNNAQVIATFGTTDVADNETATVIVNATPPATGTKQLYLDTVNSTPNLTRVAPDAAANTLVTFGTWMRRRPNGSGARTVRVDMYNGATLIGTDTWNWNANAWQYHEFSFVAGANASFAIGEQVTLVVTSVAGGNIRIRANDGNTPETSSLIEMESSTVINIDSIKVFADAAFTTQYSSYKPGDTVYIRAIVSDPFGYADITGANITITDSISTVTVNNAAMTSEPTPSGAIRIYEYQYTIPAAPDGFWSISITADEGTEGVSHTVADTMIVGNASMILLKTSNVISDPVNAGANPKRIPGSVIEYTIIATNTGFGYVDDGSVILNDPIPAQTTLYLGNPADPAQFIDGATVSGLNYTFTSLASTTDDIAFSNDGGGTFITPSVDAAGFDITVPAINFVRINPKGEMSGTDGVNNPSFNMTFRVQVD